MSLEIFQGGTLGKTMIDLKAMQYEIIPSHPYQSDNSQTSE
ncbi:hypothetical protein [Mastigocoleus testarum]|nr:hypothetical protein [Mastigocoleus testarum]